MIGIFDSGVGGLYVYQALKRELPNRNYLYLADQKFAPYGFRDKKEIVDRSRRIADFLVSRGANLIVIACNTATLNSIDELRQEFNVPIVGIEPAIKPALIKHRKILVLATHSTVKNPRYLALVKRFQGKGKIEHIGATELVSQVEAGDLTSDKLLKKIVGSRVNRATALVIGCTHFSYLKPLILKTWSHLELFDGAYGVVKRVEFLVNQGRVKDSVKDDYERFFSTKPRQKNYLTDQFNFNLVDL